MKKTSERFARIAAGAAVGAASGFFGGGGGSVGVPLIGKTLGLDVKSTHATTLAVILPVTLISAAIYLSNGFFPPTYGIPAALGVTVGGAIGARLMKVIDPIVLTRLFAALTLVAGARAALF